MALFGRSISCHKISNRPSLLMYFRMPNLVSIHSSCWLSTSATTFKNGLITEWYKRLPTQWLTSPGLPPRHQLQRAPLSQKGPNLLIRHIIHLNHLLHTRPSLLHLLQALPCTTQLAFSPYGATLCTPNRHARLAATITARWDYSDIVGIGH